MHLWTQALFGQASPCAIKPHASSSLGCSLYYNNLMRLAFMAVSINYCESKPLHHSAVIDGMAWLGKLFIMCALNSCELLSPECLSYESDACWYLGIVLTTARWQVTETTISVYLRCLRFMQTIFLANHHCGHCLVLGLAVFEAFQVFVEPVH